MSEESWWDDPPGGLEANAWGLPPYDVDRMAARIWTCLGLRQDQRVLDLGCGPGRLALKLAGQGADVVGIDSSREMISAAHHALQRWMREAATLMQLSPIFARSDGRRIPDEIAFDHAYSITVFEHIPHEATRSYIRQVHDRLPNGGRFLFSHTPGTEEPAPRHYQCDPMEVLDWLDDAGFKVWVQVPPDEVLDKEVWAFWCVQK